MSAGMAVRVILVQVGGRSMRASLNHSDWMISWWIGTNDQIS